MKKEIALLITIILLAVPLTTAAQWLPNGNIVCNASNKQFDIQMIPDGSGGAFIVWQDMRNDTGDIYAQRVDSNGVMLWANNGVVVCDAPKLQQFPRIVGILNANGSFNVCISWADHRASSSGDSTDLYAQCLNGNGNVLWAANGVRVTPTATVYLYDVRYGHPPAEPRMAVTPSKNIILVWADSLQAVARDSSKLSPRHDILAQKLDPTNGAKLWTTPVVVSGNFQQLKNDPCVVAIGDDAFVIWVDFRNNTDTIYKTNSNGINVRIYYQRISSSGSALFVSGGLSVSVKPILQFNPAVTADNANGAIVTWGANSGTFDILAQRINSLGVGQWNPAGACVSCNNQGNVYRHMSISDKAGGVITGFKILYGGLDLQHLDANGLPLFTGSDDTLAQSGVHSLSMITDSNITVAWTFGDGTNQQQQDILTQRFNLSNGQTKWPAPVNITANPRNQHNPSIVSSTGASVLVAYVDDNDTTKEDIRINRVSGSGKVIVGIHSTDFVEMPSMVLSDNYPNPFSTSTIIRVEGSGGETRKFEVRDMLGRVVYHSEIDPSQTEITFDGSQLRNGVYLYTIANGEKIDAKKMVIMK